jgi:broad specificity phosphatase PhoE
MIRGIDALQNIARSAQEQQHKHVVVVAHGRFNKIVLAELGPGAKFQNRLHDQGNCCVNVVDWDTDQGEVICDDGMYALATVGVAPALQNYWLEVV